jgi:hypothetical protein
MPSTEPIKARWQFGHAPRPQLPQRSSLFTKTGGCPCETGLVCRKQGISHQSSGFCIMFGCPSDGHYRTLQWRLPMYRTTLRTLMLIVICGIPASSQTTTRPILKHCKQFSPRYANFDMTCRQLVQWPQERKSLYIDCNGKMRR